MHAIAIAAYRAAQSHSCLLASTVLTSLMLPVCSPPALAQQSASPDLTLPEVVVSRPSARARPAAPRSEPQSTAARTLVAAPEADATVVYSPTAIPTLARDVASSVTVITSADIAREQRRTVPDALANVPGLNIVQSGGPGGQTSVFMRGTNWNKAPDPAAPGVNKGDRTRYDWRGVFEALPGQFMITGLQQETERLDTGTLMASNGMRSGYLELQMQAAQRLFLVTNVRYDDDDAFGNYTTYRVAPALLVPVTETKLKGSLGTGFKAPTLSQLFVDFRPAFNFFGNPKLKPEESVGYQNPTGFDRPGFGIFGGVRVANR